MAETTKWWIDVTREGGLGRFAPGFQTTLRVRVIHAMLRKRVHVETAMLQDEVVDLIYALEPDAVLHGGTAIWRCYDGNRFSEDLDFYMLPQEGFEKRLEEKLVQRQLELTKFKQTQNAIYSKIFNGSVEVRFEALLKDPSAIAGVEARSFRRTDGSELDVLTLSPEAFVEEKLETYLSRRLVRDYYDIYHLLRYAQDTPALKSAVRSFLSKAVQPLDAQNLSAIVYSGAVPSFEQMSRVITVFSK